MKMSRAQRRAAARAAAVAVNPSQTSSAGASTAIPEPGAPFPSLAQMTANRSNAQLSTGPVTAAGLAASSQNHTIHGLARHNGTFRLLPSEDSNGFELLKQSFAAEHQPQTETEAILVLGMVESHWLANRAQNLQFTCFDAETGQLVNEETFALYLRYHSTHTRAFHKCLNDLLKLRNERRKTEIGFEAQKRQEETQQIQKEKHEMKKQTHYWDVLLKDGKACHQISLNTLQNLKARDEHPGFEAQFAADLAQSGLERAKSAATAEAA